MIFWVDGWNLYSLNIVVLIEHHFIRSLFDCKPCVHERPLFILSNKKTLVYFFDDSIIEGLGSYMKKDINMESYESNCMAISFDEKSRVQVRLLTS